MKSGDRVYVHFFTDGRLVWKPGTVALVHEIRADTVATVDLDAPYRFDTTVSRLVTSVRPMSVVDMVAELA